MASELKIEYRTQLIDYLSNPEHEWPLHKEYGPTILNVSNQAMRQHFNPQELANIDQEVLMLRRRYYAKSSYKVDKALVEAACDGSAADRKLFYQRVEGWSEKIDHNLKGDQAVNINVTLVDDDTGPGEPGN